jgi:signal transduction histidine kinase
MRPFLYPIRSWIFILLCFNCISGKCQYAPPLDSLDIEIINAIHSGEFQYARNQLDSLQTNPQKLGQYYQDLFASRLGLYHSIRNNQDSAIAILYPLFYKQLKTTHYGLLGDIASYLGRAYQHKNDHSNAYRFFNESMQAHKKNKFNNYYGTSNCFLGYFLLNSNMLVLAKETMEQGLYFARKDTNSTEFIALSTLKILIQAKSFIAHRKLDSARMTLENLLNLVKKYQINQDEVMYWLYLGDIFILENKFEQALDYYRKAEKISEKYNLEYENAESLIGISKSYSGLKKYELALKTLEPLSRSEIQFPFFISSLIYKQLSTLYKLQGDWVKSLYYAERHIAANDSSHQNEIGVFIIHAEIIKNDYNQERLLNLNKYVKEQLQKQKIIRLSLLTVSVLLLALFLLSFLALRSRRKNIARLYQSSLELQILNKEVEQKNQSLAKMNKKLIENNESLQNFAYTAAHDLKGPLTGIFTYLQLIKYKSGNYEKLPEFIGTFTDKAFNEASRLNTLIQDLLSLSNMDKNLPNPSRVSLVDAVHHMMDVHQNVISQSQAHIVCDPHLPTLLAHRNMIESLLQNLILNAIKYKHPERDPIISISFKTTPKFIHIYISDNGLGIEKQYFKEIFQPFRRIATEVEGTGLGLNTCKKIVEYYHGKMVVRSTIHEGSTFCIILPGEMVIEN